jgi:HlyD family secretion protein
VSLKIADSRQALRSVREYQSEIAEIRESRGPVSAQYTLHAIAAMVVGITLVIAFAQTDRVVVSMDGKIVTQEKQTVVQSFDTGVIKSIDVKPGQNVVKGQLLATLDPTFSQAAVDQLRTQVDSLKAQIARDEAEIALKPLVFPTIADPDFEHYVQINTDLYNQQMANYRAQLASFDQQIELTKATIFKFSSDESRYKERVDIQHQIEGMYSTLEQHGTGSLLNSLTASDTRTETARIMEFDKNSVQENQHQLAVLQANREAFLQQFLVTASQELATAKTTLDGAIAQFVSASRHRELVRFTASEDSQVASIANLSVGSVLNPGNTLLTLTPLRVPLEAEIALSPRDIGFVRVGDPVTLKVDAFAFQEHGTVDGTVRWISEDIVDPNQPSPTSNGGAAPANVVTSTGAPLNGHYMARVSIGKINLIGTPAVFRFTPGMTLEANIKVGTHSLGQYVIGGLTRGIGDAMREP